MWEAWDRRLRRYSEGGRKIPLSANASETREEKEIRVGRVRELCDGTGSRNEGQRNAPLFGGGQAKRGPKPSGGRREAKRVRKLERENARLREELRKARIIIDVQGKVAGLLGVSPGDGKRS